MNALIELKDKLVSIDKKVSDIRVMKIIHYENGFNMDHVFIKENPSVDDLESLDYHYDDNNDIQELFGIVLFNDNTWLERSQYEDFEWWNYKKCPTVEEILKDVDEEYNLAAC